METAELFSSRQQASTFLLICWVLFYAESEAKCQTDVKSTGDKAKLAPILVVGQFLQYESRAQPNSVYKWAKFAVKTVLKGSLANTFLLLPLYSGHHKISRKVWCLNEKFLNRTRSRNLTLFLKESVAESASAGYDLIFLPATYDEKAEQTIMRILAKKAMASYDEATATPVKAETVFEMQLNTNEPHIPIIIQTAQVSPKERIRLRCRVSGAVNADNPNLFWVFRGDYLHETDLLSIESNQQQRESSLRISEFREEHVGQYECNVKRVDNKFHKTKLQLRTRPDSNHSSSLTDEVPCEPPLNTTYCQNGGVCRMHVVSKSKSCKRNKEECVKGALNCFMGKRVNICGLKPVGQVL